MLGDKIWLSQKYGACVEEKRRTVGSKAEVVVKMCKAANAGKSLQIVLVVPVQRRT